MAEIKYIDYPEHLNDPKIPERDLAHMTAEQRALAKDWNILSNKVDWGINMLVEIRNLQVDHDRLLDSVRKIKWIAGLSFGSGTIGGALLYYIITHVLNK